MSDKTRHSGPGRPRLIAGVPAVLTTKVSQELFAEAKIAAAYCQTSVSAMLRDGLEQTVEKSRRERNGGKPFLPVQPPQE